MKKICDLTNKRARRTVVAIDDELHERLHALCDRHTVPVRAAVDAAIENFLADNETLPVKKGPSGVDGRTAEGRRQRNAKLRGEQ